MDNMSSYIKPELLILIPVLYFIGRAMKISTISDKYIHFTLMCIGIVLATLYVISDESPENPFLAGFTAITQGVLCAGCSVYIDYIGRQGKK